jgi:hypothetical protein
MSRSRIVYQFRADASRESELDALSAVYALALQKYQKNQKAAGLGGFSGRDNATDPKSVCTATSSIPK